MLPHRKKIYDQAINLLNRYKIAVDECEIIKAVDHFQTIFILPLATCSRGLVVPRRTHSFIALCGGSIISTRYFTDSILPLIQLLIWICIVDSASGPARAFVRKLCHV